MAAPAREHSRLDARFSRNGGKLARVFRVLGGQGARRDAEARLRGGGWKAGDRGGGEWGRGGAAGHHVGAGEGGEGDEGGVL